VELLVTDGETLVAFQHERVHEPPRGGGSSYRKSVPLSSELLDAARRLMAALRWTGVAMVEFRQDPRSGRWIFIEINGRFWGSLPLALAAGVDFPYHLYQLLVEGRRDFPSGYRVGLHARNLLLDFEWFLASRERGLAGASRTLLSAAAEATRNLVLLRERSDALVRDDPAPGWAELAALRRRLWGNVKQRSHRVLAAVPGYSTLQATRARRALRGARTVLFVCKGNICRSPFAAAYARTVLPGPPRILSAGTYRVAGRPSPREALEAGRILGVDLSDHCSVVLNDDLVRDSDLILVFDGDNAREILERHPAARGKIHWLAALGGAGVSAVRDPYGRPLADFVAVYRQIAIHLDRARDA
jgi:protein-tyrosine-phosphatase